MNKPLSGRRILVVEDEILVRVTIEDVLANLGCESVTAAATTKEAVTLVEGQVFDAAVLDMNLNGDSSRSVADALAKRGVPFIFATGNRGEMWDGFCDRAVLRKPFKFLCPPSPSLMETLNKLPPANHFSSGSIANAVGLSSRRPLDPHEQTWRRRSLMSEEGQQRRSRPGCSGTPCAGAQSH